MFEGIETIWLVKFTIASIGVGVGLYLARFIKPFLIWIKGGIEDGDGILENKELQQAWFSVLAAYLLISYSIFDVNYPDPIIYATYGAAVGMYGLRRFSDKYEKKNDDDDKKDANF